MSKDGTKTIGFSVVTAALIMTVGLMLGGPKWLSAQHEGQSHEGHDHADHAGHDHGDHGGEMAKNPNHWGAPNGMHLYLCAFHISKERPSFAVEAHHYCSPQADMHQCVIYDGKGPGAKLLGIEYLVSDEQYQKLPASEKKYWHPHAYEIISGQLIAADLPKQGDDLFKGLIKSWGKTWHTWPDPTTKFPMGEPMLMWSANGDGQIDKAMLSKRDAQFGISTDEIRERRKSMGMEVPQIPPPKSMDELGRQFTASGPDAPKMLGGK